ncbi:MAG: hypothetical protein KA170_01140 [Candidatus Promineofilum sp.]|nr:hypothetical protein [Promineifilum sp.]
MPLSNDVNKSWDGWLVDDIGGQGEQYQNLLVGVVEKKSIPQCTIKVGTVNMWWRKDSRFIDVSSTLDGTITTTIHIQDYGTGLWIGRAVESYSASNYYKRMAAMAFIETIDRCIRDAILLLVEDSAIREVKDFGRGL